MEPISFCVEICPELILVIIGIGAVLIIARVLIFVGFKKVVNYKLMRVKK